MSSEDGAETETTGIDLRQLRHFLGWLFPTALSVAGLLLLIVLFYPTYDLIVACTGVSAYCLLLIWGRIQLARGHPQVTVGTICFGLFALALGIIATAPTSGTVLILLPFMAIAIALPYISGRVLRWLSLVGWLIALLVTTIGELDRYGSIPGLFPDGIQTILGVAVTGALILVLLWQFSNQLKTMLAQTRGANAALQEANTKLGVQHAQLLDDMVRRQQAEEALRRSEEQFRLLFEAAPIGMTMTALDGRFLRVNPALCTTLGYSEGEMLQRTGIDMTHPDDRLAQLALNQQLLDGTRSLFQFEKRYIGKDGHVMDALLQVVLVRDAQGQPLHFITQVVDITERKRAEAQRLEFERRLLETQKLESIGVLAGGIAHDFNNLLVGILGNADLALLELPPGSPIQPRVAQIETAARRAAELTQQLLAYAGKGRFVVGKIELNTLIRETAQLLGASVTKHVRLHYDLAPDMLAIEGDATQLRQVVMNLLINASEAIGERDGTIAVRTATRQLSAAALAEAYHAPNLPAGDYVLLEVADSGTGMDVATLAKIFDPFFTTKFTGRGLGLAAVQGIVRGHGGALAVQSALGQGTTFSVLLPGIGQAVAASPERAPETAAEPGSGVVLVIDDELDVRLIAEQMLQLIGFGVLQAQSGPAGIAVFRKRADELACVLLDLTMPHMDGADVLRALHGIRTDVPILLMSGYSEQEAHERFDGVRPAGFLQKPFTISSLQQKLQQVLMADDRTLQL